MHSKAELIFMKWKAELASLDRSMPMVEGNFELLWDHFFRAKIKMDKALTFIDRACKAHHPSNATIKSVFRKMAPYIKENGIQEYEKTWKEKIDDKCKEVFFAFYEIGGIEKTSGGKIGGMSKAENAKLQSYADSHETVDWEALIEEKQNAEALIEDDGPDIDVSQVQVDIDLGEL